MSKKIEIVGFSIRITDTISGDIELSQPSARVWYREEFLAIGRIDLYDIDGVEENENTLTKINLSDAVDSGLTPFTESTFRDFASSSLGFSTAGSTAKTTKEFINRVITDGGVMESPRCVRDSLINI